MNISLPYPKEELEKDNRGGAWPHVDQSPNRRFKHCVQGIMNLVSGVCRGVLVRKSGLTICTRRRTAPMMAVS